MRCRASCLVLLTVALSWVGCETPGAYTLREHRAIINKLCQKTLKELYVQQPDAMAAIEAAAGFAVFREGGLKVALPGKGEGYGFAVDNHDGKRTFMRTGSIAPGFQAVFVFENKETLQRFTTSGWEFGDEVPADVRVYQIGDVALIGTRYWIDRVLN